MLILNRPCINNLCLFLSSFCQWIWFLAQGWLKIWERNIVNATVILFIMDYSNLLTNRNIALARALNRDDKNPTRNRVWSHQSKRRSLEFNHVFSFGIFAKAPTNINVLILASKPRSHPLSLLYFGGHIVMQSVQSDVFELQVNVNRALRSLFEFNRRNFQRLNWHQIDSRCTCN